MDKKQEMINKDRTWRIVACLNPAHETVKLETNEIGNILCPLCNSPMVSVIKMPLEDKL